MDAGGLLLVGAEWCGPRHVLGRGESGADKALLEVLGEDVADRFDEVVLVSGDAIFTKIVSDLTGHGVVVTVIAHEAALSRRLRLAATRVEVLSTGGSASTSRVPRPRSTSIAPCAQPA